MLQQLFCTPEPPRQPPPAPPDPGPGAGSAQVRLRMEKTLWRSPNCGYREACAPVKAREGTSAALGKLHGAKTSKSCIQNRSVVLRTPWGHCRHPPRSCGVETRNRAQPQCKSQLRLSQPLAPQGALGVSGRHQLVGDN